MPYRTTIVGLLCTLVWSSLGTHASGQDQTGELLRLGMIGLDTSHVIAFTSILNNPDHKEHVPGARVVAAFKGGSPDLPSSWDRVEQFTEQLRKDYGVEIVDSIPKLCGMVDGVLIESVDGRPHLWQAKQVINAGKPMFIDKPVAGSFKDGFEIARLAEEAGVPWFGGSSLRWTPQLREALDAEKIGQVLGCDAFSPCSLEPHHPDLFWYGVHGVEILYAAMGRGCVSVTRTATRDGDLVAGLWKDGRTGTFRGTRKGAHDYGATIFGTKAITTVQGHTYRGLVEEIVRFFQTKEPPIDPWETVEMLAFMEAADESKQLGGVPVPVPKFPDD
jgi:hypothetical protein